VFEYIGHPIPTGPHIEKKSFGREGSRPTSNLIVLLEYGYLMASLSQKASAGQTGKSGSNDYQSFVFFHYLFLAAKVATSAAKKMLAKVFQ
jgi:hypothetical protein